MQIATSTSALLLARKGETLRGALIIKGDEVEVGGARILVTSAKSGRAYRTIEGLAAGVRVTKRVPLDREVPLFVRGQ